MRLWINDPDTREGKYLLVRRDGTIPDWPHFAIGAKDPAAHAALMAYADEAERLDYDPAMVADVRALADRFAQYCLEVGQGDPDAPRHRTDDPRVIQKMREGGHVFDDPPNNFAPGRM